MVDLGLGADELESMGMEAFALLDRKPDLGDYRAGVAGGGEVGAVIGQHGVDPIGNGCDEIAEEIAGDMLRGLFVQFDEGELRCSVYGDRQVELSLPGADFANVDVKIADWVGPEPLLGGLRVVRLGQAGDAVAL